MYLPGIIGIVLILLVSSVSISAAKDTAPPSPQPERIELPGGGGEALLWPGGNRAVLLAHGAVYDAASWSVQARELQFEGYTVLAVEDISGSALVSAIGWLMDEHGATGVVVIGASAGGAGALSAVAEHPSGVAGLVLLSATGPVEGLGDYPKLFAASDGEGMQDRLETMAADAPGDSNRVEIIPGSAHAQATFEEDEGRHLLDAILTFLNEEAAWPDGSGTPAATPTGRGRSGRG